MERRSFLTGLAASFAARPCIGQTTVRTLLTRRINLYVSRSGHDANDGLTWATAKATGQGAINELARKYDIGLTTPIIQFSEEEHNAAMSLRSVPGGGTIIVQGNVENPRSVPLIVAENYAVNYPGGSVPYLLRGFFIKGQWGALRATELGRLKFEAVEFGETDFAHVIAARGGQVFCNGDYSISGGGMCHFYSEEGGLVHVSGRTITIENEPLFRQAFARATLRSQIQAPANTFNGAVNALTKRYSVEQQSIIGTNYSGESYLPGGVAGTCDATSLYA